MIKAIPADGEKRNLTKENYRELRRAIFKATSVTRVSLQDYLNREIYTGYITDMMHVAKVMGYLSYYWELDYRTDDVDDALTCVLEELKLNSFEILIGEALLSSGEDRELLEARIYTKHAVCTKMICDCGDVLDQSSAVYVEDVRGNPVTVLCPKCAEIYLGEADKHGAKYIKYTWDGGREEHS